MSDLGWIAILMVGVTMTVPLMLFATSGSKAAEIAACMTQPDMEYVKGNCLRRTTDE